MTPEENTKLVNDGLRALADQLERVNRALESLVEALTEREKTKCQLCGRENVELHTNVWFKGAMLCNACSCSWADNAAGDWEQLKEQSLASGDRWFKTPDK